MASSGAGRCQNSCCKRKPAGKRQRQLKVIAAVKLPYLPPEKRKSDILAVGGFADIAQQSQGKMLAFGEFPLVHVTMQTGRDYIEARSGSYIPRGGGEPKTRNVSTIKRDIVHMSSVFAHIEFAKDLRQKRKFCCWQRWTKMRNELIT